MDAPFVLGCGAWNLGTAGLKLGGKFYVTDQQCDLIDG
jgi:hypothetical protein